MNQKSSHEASADARFSVNSTFKGDYDPLKRSLLSLTGERRSLLFKTVNNGEEPIKQRDTLTKKRTYSVFSNDVSPT